MPRGKLIPFPDGGRRRPARPAPAAERGLVEVHRCDQAEAVVARSLLESERIPTLLRSVVAHSVHPFSVGQAGTVIILVPAAEVGRARRLLARRPPA